MTPHTHDAWIIGVHDLPTDLTPKPRNIVMALTTMDGEGEGLVLLHDLQHGRWSLLDAETFDDEYEFV